MDQLTHQNIKNIESTLEIHYKDHRISYYRKGKTFIINIYDEDSDKIETHIIKDKVFDDCILDLLNIVLKPYINKAIKDFQNI